MSVDNNDIYNKAQELVKAFGEKLGRVPTAAVITFGCQMNARDSEKLVGILVKMGYVETDNENADFVIYNTCTVRENANNKVYGRLGILHGYKKKNKGIVATSSKIHQIWLGDKAPLTPLSSPLKNSIVNLTFHIISF